jgi:GR25 family glycosyltransferase involved in LPS biosynthesis
MLMKAFIISLVNNHEATVATRHVIESIKTTKSELEAIILPATTPQTIDEGLDSLDMRGVKWTYPIKPEQDGVDIKTGLRLTHYPTANHDNRVACMISHMRCWKKAIDLNETIVILEHDALFTRYFSPSPLTSEWKGGILGLNNPIGATRRAHIFDGQVRKIQGLQGVPSVDDWDVPQGLAGNSAYMISPKAAKKLLNKVKEIGMWPNDALMCKQMFPWMQVVYPYYTKIQKGLKSTTTQ